MVDRLPSLIFLLGLVQSERDKQLTHFDALDNKAGIVLAFAGFLITLAPDVPTVTRVVGILAAGSSVALSLYAFWPRRFPTLDPGALRHYLRAEEAFTQLTVLDTLEEFVDDGSRLLQTKGRRLGWALRFLGLAAISFAAGIVSTTMQG